MRSLRLVVSYGLAWLAPCGLASSLDGGTPFKPELVGVELTSRAVRPGDPFALTLKFRNAGGQAAASDYMVFVHFEAAANCRKIAMQADHAPEVPTSLWRPGQLIVDGPRVLAVPADLEEQEYFLHVGVFDHAGKSGRLLDSYASGKFRVNRQAPSPEQLGPPRLATEEVTRRRAALAARIPAAGPVSLETRTCRLDVDRTTGAWTLVDKATGVLWTSDAVRPHFGELLLTDGARSAIWQVDRFAAVESSPQKLGLVTRPQVGGQAIGMSVRFTIEPTSGPDGLRLAYAAEGVGPWRLARVRLLDGAMAVTEEDEGRVYIPHRLGIERAAAKAFPGRETWRTYDNLSMAMCGLVKQGSALLVNWECPDTRLTLESDWPDLPLVAGRRSCSLGLSIEAPQGGCTIHPLGRGGYVEIARAYRGLAGAKGWRTTWAEKLKAYPTSDRLWGAANFKPFVLSRVLPGTRFNTGKQERVYLGYTFDEVAQCAEHWRNDLGIDKALVVLAGWIQCGYDVGHPDVLPAAPECGGNDGLASAAARIKACGYLFGLHDNYQDMYEDAPSWGQQWLNKDAKGVSKRGGNWNGGQAWQVCAIQQVKLAERPETNLPKIAQLFGPTIYFIDTVFAWGLVTCEDPAHPMTRLDDLHWKTKLCLAAKKHFGLFGSEEGREWSVPCADYLEGIFGHQTDSPPGDVIPLFPLVYSDCVQIMTHQSNRIAAGDEKKMADHVLFGQMPLPQFGPHLYWKQPEPQRIKLGPLPPAVKDLGDRKLAITYRWRLGERIDWDGSFFVHFIHPKTKRAEGIVFQNDHRPRLPLSKWQPGIVEDGPYTLEIPAETKGRLDIAVGLLHNGQRTLLSHASGAGPRYVVGALMVQGKQVSYQPLPREQAEELWSRGDGGWGESLCRADRVIKNAWEVLSPLNRLIAQRPFDTHEFLTADRLVQRTRRDELTITVAYEKPARIGDHVVPAGGFVVESPQYLAFCATRFNGLEYADPVLFTARSLDGKPIAHSSRVRIYHGFGDPRIKLAGREFRVPREAIVSLQPDARKPQPQAAKTATGR